MGKNHQKLSLDPSVLHPSQQKRILFFVQDGTGLGHLRRLARIAQQLQGPFACLLVSGYRAAHWFIPDECEYVHLPSWDNLIPNKAIYWGRNPFLLVDKKEAFELRGEILKGIIRGYRPDAIVVDHLPMGKWEELANIIKEVPAKKYYVTRGVLDRDTEDIHDLLGGKAKEYLENYYDRILVACDIKIFDFSKEYNVSSSLLQKITHTGYVAESINQEQINKARIERGLQKGDKWVVCSSGGGQQGENLIEECIKISKIFKNVYFDIVLGPRTSISWQSLSKNYVDEGNVRLHKESKYLHRLHASADIVITAGGYNSLVEALQGKALIICFPFRISINDEQYQHSICLSEYVHIEVSTDLSMLQQFLEHALEKISKEKVDDRRNEINFMGSTVIKNILLKDFCILNENKYG